MGGNPGPDLDRKKPCNRESKANPVYHNFWCTAGNSSATYA